MGYLSSATAASPAFLIDTGGFEASDGQENYVTGEKAEKGGLVGQHGWVAFPESSKDGIVLTRFGTVDGEVSLRTATGGKRGAARAIQLNSADGPPETSPRELVLRARLGNGANDDVGVGVIGLTRSLQQPDFVSIRRLGDSNKVRVSGPSINQPVERPVATSDVTGDANAVDIELVLRMFPGEDNDRASARYRAAGAADWSYLPVQLNAIPDAEGFTDLGTDVPSGELFFYVVLTNPNWKASVRADNLEVLLRPAPAHAEPGGTSLGSARETVPQLYPVTRNVFPAEAAVLDVTQPPYNAKGDGITDDTDAIQRALNAYPSGNRIVFLPNGTYKITDTLEWPRRGTVPRGREEKNLILEGESRDGVVLQLPDAAPGYQDPENRKAVIWTGNAPAQRFRNSVRNLTVDTGRSNPGASGIQYNVSNQGTVRDVTIRSGDGQGVIGLDMAFTHEIGNGYIRDVLIEGFQRGIHIIDPVNGMLFENIELRGQSELGILNDGQVLTFLNLKYTGPGPAVVNAEGRGGVSLIGAELVQTSDNAGPAILNQTGVIYLRDVRSRGFSRLLENESPDGRGIAGLSAEEFISHATPRPGPAPRNPMAALPIRDVPPTPIDPADQWANPLEFGAIGDGKTDDTRALQAAIDSGKTTIYLPPTHNFFFAGEVVIRGAVHRFVGTEGMLNGPGTLVIGDGEPDTVFLERFVYDYGPGKNSTILHESDRTLVINHCKFPALISRSRGDLFITDFSSHKWKKIRRPTLQLLQPGQNVWLRNFNSELYYTSKIINRGANLWIAQFKSEEAGTCLETTHGGRTEMIGAHIYSQGIEKTTPVFVAQDSALRLINVRQYTFNKMWFDDYVAYSNDGSSWTMKRLDAPFDQFLPMLVTADIAAQAEPQ